MFLQMLDDTWSCFWSNWRAILRNVWQLWAVSVLLIAALRLGIIPPLPVFIFLVTVLVYACLSMTQIVVFRKVLDPAESRLMPVRLQDWKTVLSATALNFGASFVFGFGVLLFFTVFSKLFSYSNSSSLQIAVGLQALWFPVLLRALLCLPGMALGESLSLGDALKVSRGTGVPLLLASLLTAFAVGLLYAVVIVFARAVQVFASSMGVSLGAALALPFMLAIGQACLLATVYWRVKQRWITRRPRASRGT